MEPIELLPDETVVKEYKYVHSRNVSACLTVTNRRIINRARKNSNLLCQVMPLQSAGYFDCRFQVSGHTFLAVLGVLFLCLGLVCLPFEIRYGAIPGNYPISSATLIFLAIIFAYTFSVTRSYGITIHISGDCRKTDLLSFESAPTIRRSQNNAFLFIPLPDIDKAIAADLVKDLNRVILTAQDQGK